MKQKVDNQTIARTVVLAIALINQILAILGKGTVDIAENDVYQVASLLATIITTLVAWWKNNSFTEGAIESDKIMKRLKGGNEKWQ